ncbi:MAG: element excision factor XisI family protein [Bacteroidota bacterium]
MDRINQRHIEYHNHILELMESTVMDYPLNPELKDHILYDVEKGHYQLLRIGWSEKHRIFQVLMHFELREDGKVWIQENLTELAVDEELLKKGIPSDDIVLGLEYPLYRRFTDFAEA